MNPVKIKSYAKVNLALNIIGKNQSFHKIESIIAFVDLYDLIMIRKIKSKTHKILFTGKFSNKIGKDNTVSKLIQILEKKNLLRDNKFEITINKKIPIKAGLGGGSMNAASILKYFLKRKIVKISKKETIQITKAIGSDVILGLNSTYSVLTSRNRINNFKNSKLIHLLIVKPNFGCSTKEIYSKVKRFDRSQFSRPNKKMFTFDYLKKMKNSLEPIALAKYPKLKSVKVFLENLSGPIFVRMTGSGSALVAYFQSKKKRDDVKKQFYKKYKNYWCAAAKTI